LVSPPLHLGSPTLPLLKSLPRHSPTSVSYLHDVVTWTNIKAGNTISFSPFVVSPTLWSSTSSSTKLVGARSKKWTRYSVRPTLLYPLRRLRTLTLRTVRGSSKGVSLNYGFSIIVLISDYEGVDLSKQEAMNGDEKDLDRVQHIA